MCFRTLLTRTLASAAIVISTAVSGTTFTLPTDGSTVVGQIRRIVPSPENTLLDIARYFDVGYEEMVLANPEVSVWTPGESAQVVVPLRFILPPRPWKGIVVNIPQRRLYFFPPSRKGQPRQVVTYPVSIAREGWSTPLGTTLVTAKYRDPAWLVPLRIKNERRREGGVEMPEYFPPGPDNPMGMHAIATGFKAIFIHGTNRPWGVGMRTSHGCLHLYPEDALELFSLVRQDTPVRIINEPFLVGVDRGRWVMASFPLVHEYPNKRSPFTQAFELVGAKLSEKGSPSHGEIDWVRVQSMVDAPQVIPLAIGHGQPDLAEWLTSFPVERYANFPYGTEANDARLPTLPMGTNAQAGSAADGPLQ